MNLLNFSMPAFTPSTTITAETAKKARCISTGAQVVDTKPEKSPLAPSGAVFRNSSEQALKKYSRDQPPMTL